MGWWADELVGWWAGGLVGWWAGGVVHVVMVRWYTWSGRLCGEGDSVQPLRSPSSSPSPSPSPSSFILTLNLPKPNPIPSPSTLAHALNLTSPHLRYEGLLRLADENLAVGGAMVLLVHKTQSLGRVLDQYR